ncbi:MAG: hypothetical protein ACI4SO_03515 [Muribaculaceae bacterium]
MKKLKLHIDKKTFNGILAGEVKEISRYIYPTNLDRYVTVDETETETIVTPIEYDELILVNGRTKSSPTIEAEIDDGEFVVMTDENGNDLTYTENGKEYYVCQMVYYLGEIISTENI